MSSFDYMAGIPISSVLLQSQKKKKKTLIILKIIPNFEAIVEKSNQYQGISNSMENTKSLIIKEMNTLEK